MNQRRFLFLFSLAIIIHFTGFSQTNATTKGAKKPNIIFILTDDHRADALGYVGNKLAVTPEMDKLAQSGT